MASFQRTSDTATSWFRAKRKAALTEITSTASGVAGSLEQLIRRCDDVGQPSPEAEEDAERQMYEAMYGDPVFLKARCAMQQGHGTALGSLTAAGSGGSTEGEDEAMRELHGIAQHIRATLDELQGSSWAADALQHLHGGGASAAEGGGAISAASPSPARLRRGSIGGGALARRRRSSFNGGSPASYPSDGDGALPRSRRASVLAAAAAMTASDESGETGSESSLSSDEDGDEDELCGEGSTSLEPPAYLGRRRSSAFGVLGPSGEVVLDVPRLRLAFRRFRMPDSAEVHKDDLENLLRYVGHVATDGADEILREVTPYDQFDFDEFRSFLEKFVPFEMTQFRRIFKEFDEDRSGDMSMSELKNLLAAMGFIPIKKMVEETLVCAELDIEKPLEFADLIKFLRAYQESEGFTQEEVVQMGEAFKRFSRDREGKVLAPDHMADALVAVFGLHVYDQVAAMEAQLISGGFHKAASPSAGQVQGGLDFDEFLIMGRRVRQENCEKLEEMHPEWVTSRRGSARDQQAGIFEDADLDGSGGISDTELRLALTKLGFTPLRHVIAEILAEVADGPAEAGDRDLNFHEFFEFLLVLQQREGFLKATVEDMRRVFERFDNDASGEVSALELAQLFRHLGYTASLDELHVFVKEVDANESGQLDVREFLRLMHLHRESELLKYGETFNAHRIVGDIMPLGEVEKALGDLGFKSPKTLRRMPSSSPPFGLDFDDFVGIVDECREEFLVRQRKFANFTDKRIETFQRMFNCFDKDRSGSIDKVELLDLLRHIGLEPQSYEEQQLLVKKLETARERAREAGCPDVGSDGQSLSFYTFIQLARTLEMEREEAEQRRVDTLMVDLRFSQPEVEDFRKIFCERKKASRGHDGPTALVAEEPTGLDDEAVRKIMRSLVVSIPAQDKALLDHKLKDLIPAGKGLLDFPGFLTLMRWLLDTDFTGLSGRLANRHGL